MHKWNKNNLKGVSVGRPCVYTHTDGLEELGGPAAINRYSCEVSVGVPYIVILRILLMFADTKDFWTVGTIEI